MHRTRPQGQDLAGNALAIYAQDYPLAKTVDDITGSTVSTVGDSNDAAVSSELPRQSCQVTAAASCHA